MSAQQKIKGLTTDAYNGTLREARLGPNFNNN
jgi:hypothetical protein